MIQQIIQVASYLYIILLEKLFQDGDNFMIIAPTWKSSGGEMESPFSLLTKVEAHAPALRLLFRQSFEIVSSLTQGTY